MFVGSVKCWFKVSQRGGKEGEGRGREGGDEGGDERKEERRKERKRRRKQQGRKTTGKENQKSMEKHLSSCYVNAIPLTSSRLALQHSPPVFIHLQDSSGFLRILQDFFKGFLRILFSGFFRIPKDFSEF